MDLRSLQVPLQRQRASLIGIPQIVHGQQTVPVKPCRTLFPPSFPKTVKHPGQDYHLTPPVHRVYSPKRTPAQLEKTLQHHRKVTITSAFGSAVASSATPTPSEPRAVRSKPRPCCPGAKYRTLGSSPTCSAAFGSIRRSRAATTTWARVGRCLPASRCLTAWAPPSRSSADRATAPTTGPSARTPW